MAISEEMAKKNKDCFAVTCCRFEEGTVIKPSNIEDPNLIPDLEVSGLLEIPEDALKIGEVLGGTLKKTVDALTPLTPALVEGYTKIDEKMGDTQKVGKVKEVSEIQETDEVGKIKKTNQHSSNSIKIKIGEGKDINIEIPIPLEGSSVPQVEDIGNMEAKGIYEPENPLGQEIEEQEIRSLKRKYFKINEVKRGMETKIDGTTLYIREGIEEDAIAVDNLVVDLKLDIVTENEYNQFSNTIMDIQPIATKEEGELGEGITRVLDGVVMMVTGTDEKGVQIGEFGSSEGVMKENIMWGRPGAPKLGEILIKTNVTIEEGKNMERPGPMAAHKATDFITQEIREALKETENDLVVEEKQFIQKRRFGKKKVVIVKEIMGQGAMHDNYLLPQEPVGVLGAKANVDLGNVPIVVSPLQVLDGCIHALTCIGPASKETSRHYFREPLILEAMDDEEIDLVGIVFVGSPQANSEKFYVSNLLGMTVEAMDIDGAIVTTEGFGNNHVDFSSHIEQIGKRGVPVVGMTFAAEQGQLVVGNKYMDAMIDLNKSEDGIENEILENNCLCKEDALRALYMLKAKMVGEEVKAPERQYDYEVKLNNIKLIEQETGQNIELVDNEQSLKSN